MTEPFNPRRPKHGTWAPQPETVALMRVSGNSINGVGETSPRRPSPLFWHPPDQHPWGDLQLLARKNSRKCPGSTEAFQGAYTYPELIPVAETCNESSPRELAEAVKSFAFSHEADDVGIAIMDPLYVFEAYSIDHPWVKRLQPLRLAGRYNSRQFVAFEGAAIAEVHVALTLIRFGVTADRPKHIADETKGLRAGMRQLSTGSC